MSSDQLPPNPPCAGVWTTDISNDGGEGERRPPGCCEVHMLPWGHDRADLGWLAGRVSP